MVDKLRNIDKNNVLELQQLLTLLFERNPNLMTTNEHKLYLKLYTLIMSMRIKAMEQNYEKEINVMIQNAQRLNIPNSQLNEYDVSAQMICKNFIKEHVINDRMAVNIHKNGEKSLDPLSQKYNKDVAQSLGVPESSVITDFFPLIKSNNSNKSNKNINNAINTFITSDNNTNGHKKHTRYEDPHELHGEHSLWSSLKHKGTKFGLGMIHYIYIYISFYFCLLQQVAIHVSMIQIIQIVFTVNMNFHIYLLWTI